MAHQSHIPGKKCWICWPCFIQLTKGEPMASSSEMLQQVQQLLIADTDLQARLSGAEDMAQAAAMMAAAAAQKGLQGVRPS
jgi:ABC-type sugar transport system substrate-binding protein